MTRPPGDPRHRRDPRRAAGHEGHYFADQPAARSSPSEVTLDLPDGSLRLRTDRGVFAGQAVDRGTRYLLLESPPPPERGELVDLGAGYGPIALTLARRAPRARVWAVEVNARARELCRENARAAGLGNVEVVDPAGVPETLVVDGLWSNPPIRVGKAALDDLLEQWLARLTPTARAWLVVQRHLGADSLARRLAGHGHPVRRIGSRQGYRLLEVGRG